MTNDPQVPVPEWGEVREYETEYQPVSVPVHLSGTPTVDARPARRSVMRRYTVPYFADPNNAPPIEVVPGDPRIKHVWFQSSGNNPGDIYIGTYEQVIQSSIGTSTDAFQYHGSVIFGPLEGFETPLYAYAQVTGTNIMSVRIEYWAD